MLGLVVFFAAGCRPTNVLEEKVNARTAFDFTMWRVHIAKMLTPPEQQELTEMIQEISYWVTTRGKATGSVAVDEAVRGEIDGLTVRALLLKGYEMKRRRLDLEKVKAEIEVATNSRLRTRPGDSDSADYLALVRQRQADRLQDTIRDLHLVEKRMEALDGSFTQGSANQKVQPMEAQPQLLTTSGR
jgi:hypothetical protein